MVLHVVIVSICWLYTCHALFREYLSGSQSGSSGVPWLAVSVWGFEDSPISWYPCEHGSLNWGDNHYTVVLFPDNHFWTIISLGSHDIVR